MTEELLAAPVEDAVIPVEGSDLAPDTGENQEEKIEFSEPQQKVFKHATDQLTFKRRQAEREHEVISAKKDARIAELEAKIPKDMRPNIPEMPDSLDDDFSQQVQARDEAIRQQQAFDTRETLALEQQQTAAVQAQTDAQEANNERVATFNQNAITLGTKPEELQRSENTLIQMGINADLAIQLLVEGTGPLMTNYLAANPDVFDQLNHADQWSRGIILNDVRLKAAEMKPQQTAAPAPADVLTGGGSTSTERGPKGARYE